MRKTTGTILIVDDNPEALIAMQLYLEKHFTEVSTEQNPNLIPNILRSKAADVIILDMNFSAGISSGNEGLYWLREILSIDPLAAVVLITAYGDIELAVKGIKLGAHDFLSKPWENEKLLATVNTAYKMRKSSLEIRDLKSKQRHLSSGITTKTQLYKSTSAAMQNIQDTVDKIASTDANVLILGENGTGKEVLAREIHAASGRELFIPVDVAAFPDSLIESELFGYQKGAFTGAMEDKPGRFELADGGTLFLDEIGNIPAALQSKILTVLQTRQVTRLGSTKPRELDFRLITATNANLDQLVEQELFRADLLYRINTITIELPPLRERLEDMEGLTDFFVALHGNKYKKGDLKVHPGVYRKLAGHHWPGNLREMSHTIEKAVIMAEDGTLKATDFQLPISTHAPRTGKKVFSLAEHEKIVIGEAMKACNGNLSETADRLGITRATLYRKIKKYEL